jgi:hypothetical protein
MTVKEVRELSKKTGIPAFVIKDAYGLPLRAKCHSKTLKGAANARIRAKTGSEKEYVIEKRYLEIAHNILSTTNSVEEVERILEELTWGRDVSFQYDLIKLAYERWYALVSKRSEAMRFFSESDDDSEKEFLSLRKLIELPCTLEEAKSDYESASTWPSLQILAAKKVVSFFK